MQNYLQQIQQGIEGVRNETWEHFIAHIPLRATKELVQQRASLLSITNEEVVVGLPTAKLLKLVRENHLKILQTVVKKVWGKQMKIRLVISDKGYR